MLMDHNLKIRMLCKPVEINTLNTSMLSQLLVISTRLA